jgi:hypothetical protein
MIKYKEFKKLYKEYTGEDEVKDNVYAGDEILSFANHLEYEGITKVFYAEIGNSGEWYIQAQVQHKVGDRYIGIITNYDVYIHKMNCLEDLYDEMKRTEEDAQDIISKLK